MTDGNGRPEGESTVNTSNSLLPEMLPARHGAAFIIYALFLCLTSVNKETLPLF